MKPTSNIPLLLLIRNRLAPVLTGPPVLAFLPAITLGAFWLGGDTALLAVALGLPALFAALGLFYARPDGRPGSFDRATGLLHGDDFQRAVAGILENTNKTRRKSACFIIELDDHRDFTLRHGRIASDLAVQRSSDRIRAAVRDNDVIARLGDSRFAVCLAPVHQLDLELCIQLAGRIQSTIEDPISLGGTSAYISCSIGFCALDRAPDPNAADWLDAATAALNEALRTGPSNIRAFSPDIQHRIQTQTNLRDEVCAALESGQIQPWFQPQISTDTGKVTGFEALARWRHPVRGILGPDAFLPAIEDAGLMERLGQVMLYNALTALRGWNSAGAEVPQVGVNFASDELRNPGLVDRVRWELDRFDVAPERLSVEVLETVFSNSPDDIISRNIAGLRELGCRIDLDDFGTGHASIASIRRFEISRIKIDRSFVMKADQDPEQQRMVAAILTLAERLELETLAEGVETVGEHALLAQLGCDHVQGFGIGKPMPFEQTLDWIAAHEEKLRQTPRIGRETG